MTNPFIDEMPITVNRRDTLIDGLWAGDFGEVEFTELALGAGMSLDEINQTLNDVREEDGAL
jgi:hypothetical protein